MYIFIMIRLHIAILEMIKTKQKIDVVTKKTYNYPSFHFIHFLILRLIGEKKEFHFSHFIHNPTNNIQFSENRNRMAGCSYIPSNI